MRTVLAHLRTMKGPIMTNDATSITIDLDANIRASIDNYNRYRHEAREASSAYGRDLSNAKLKRESNRAAKSFANASMGLGWTFASALKKAGVEIDE
jgi:hypothetical protein